MKFLRVTPIALFALASVYGVSYWVLIKKKSLVTLIHSTGLAGASSVNPPDLSPEVRRITNKIYSPLLDLDFALQDARLRRLVTGSWRNTSGNVHLTVDSKGSCQLQFPDKAGSTQNVEAQMIMKDATGYINLPDLNLIIFLHLEEDKTDVLHFYAAREIGDMTYLNKPLHRVPPP